MEPGDLDEGYEKDEALERFHDSEFQKEAFRRKIFYHDIEKLILVGFITHPVRLRGVPFIFRSSTEEMSDRLIERSRAFDNFSLRSWILASSTWMVDGMIVGNDPSAEYLLFKEVFSSLHEKELKALYSIIEGLGTRVSRCFELAEAYCYEPYSRNSWRPSLKDIPRSEDNPIRRMWRAFNLVEDSREEDFNRWEHTRASVASMTSKGAKAMATEEKKLRDREKMRRNSVIEEAITKRLSGTETLDGNLVSVTLDGETFEVPVIMSPRSSDELFAEMDKAMKNKKDYHDLVVDKYKRGIQERFEQEREQREELYRRASEQAYEDSNSEGTPLVGYTSEQLREMKLTTPFTPKKEYAPNESSSRLYDRYVKQEVKVGWIGVKGLPEEAGNDAPTRAPQPSLDEALKSRKPTLR